MRHYITALHTESRSNSWPTHCRPFIRMYVSTHAHSVHLGCNHTLHLTSVPRKHSTGSRKPGYCHHTHFSLHHHPAHFRTWKICMARETIISQGPDGIYKVPVCSCSSFTRGTDLRSNHLPPTFVLHKRFINCFIFVLLSQHDIVILGLYVLETWHFIRSPPKLANIWSMAFLKSKTASATNIAIQPMASMMHHELLSRLTWIVWIASASRNWEKSAKFVNKLVFLCLRHYNFVEVGNYSSRSP